MSFLDKILFLRQGKQTLNTQGTESIAKSISGGSKDKIDKIISFVSSLKYTGFNAKLFRKRTVDQIIKDGFTTGCTDSCLVFVALSRVCKIPAKYAETIDKIWLESGSDNSIQGHQYAQVWIKEENRWVWVDPLGARFDTDTPEKEGRVIYKVGLDSWDIGIDSFDKLRNYFLRFKQKYNINKQ